MAMAKVESVMRRDPVCCTPDEGVVECARMMEQEDVGMIAVVESRDTRKLVGVVTDRDICIEVVGAGRDPTECTVEDCMTDELFTVKASDDLGQALELMARERIRRVPVVDDGGAIVGVVEQPEIGAAPDSLRASVAEIVKPT